METPEHKWNVGELVPLTWNERLLKKSGSTSYAELVNSCYICVREATDEQPGILVKVLGKVTRNQILLVNGNPFCKDDRHRCQPKAPTTIRGGIHALYADYLHLIYL